MPRLHQIQVPGYKYPERATSIRIQVDTCSRDDNFVADTGYNVDGDRRYKCMDTSGYIVSGVIVKCGLMPRLHLIHVARIQVISTCIPCRRLYVSSIGDKIVVTATSTLSAIHCLELVSGYMYLV